MSQQLAGQMLLNGTASGSCDCYVLTTAGPTQAGSIWSPSTISLSNPFDFKARIFLGASDAGADGMTFVLRQSGTSTGTGGGLLGYGGILNSVAVEIDTWNNGTGGDIASDHLGMNSNGVVTHNLVAPVAIPNIENGLWHDFRVTWNPITFQMQVFLDGASMFTYTGDLVTSIFGGIPDVRFGFTAATGGATNLQQVCLDLDANFTADDITVCPGQEVFFTDLTNSGLSYNGVDVTTYAWNFGGGVTSALENPSHTYYTIGTKTISLTVTNMIGCTDIQTHTVTVDSIDISVAGTNVTCFGFDDGTATVTPLTGDAPYTYLWDDPLAQTTATAIGLAPGVYTVTVTDAVGCVQTRSITIIEPDALVLVDAIVTNATCGLADGTLDLVAGGGTTPYEYSINAGASFEAISFYSGLPDGVLDIQLRDANGCVYSGTVMILSDPLGLSASFTNSTCFGYDNATATVTTDFGVGPCSYLWDDPLAQTTATATNLAPGTYTVLVTHIAVGCSGTISVTISEPNELLINSLSVVNASCGINNGQISIEAIGGTLPYSFSVDGGVTFSPSPSFTGLAPGSYDIYVKDANGCFITDLVTIINVSNVPVVVIDADPDNGCKALEVNFTNLSDPLLTNITSWNLGDGTTATGEFVNHTYTAAGCYDIHVDITTFDGCSTSGDFNDFICVWELPIADFSYTPDQPDILENTVQFDNLSEFASNYSWTFGDGGTSALFEPSHTYAPIGNSDYLVELIVTTDKGCADTAYNLVTIDEVVIYFIPNVFTPDGDDLNSMLNIYFIPGFVPADFYFSIYDRYGEILWESYNPSVGWNGTYGDRIVEDGVYIWKLTFRENGSDKKYSDYGHVTILK